MSELNEENQEIVQYLSSLDSGLKSLLLQLRDIVLSAHVEIKEDIRWNCLTYSLKEVICAFKLTKTHITIVFFNGSDIEDDYKLLKVYGKRSRCIKVLDPLLINTQAISSYVKQSVQNINNWKNDDPN